MERKLKGMGMMATATNMAGRKRVEAVVETLAAIHHHGENLAELTHDARNMVTALALYCDLLEEPGVLADTHRHYASELRLVAEASRRLVEKLALIEENEPGQTVWERISAPRQGHLFPTPSDPNHLPGAGGIDAVPGGWIGDLRAELLAVRELLATIAGPAIRLTVIAVGGAYPVRMTGENLIRVLVNLVKNSAESISGPGTIQLTLAEGLRSDGTVRSLILTLDDSGCGISPDFVEKVFQTGFTTRAAAPSDGRWGSGHRGLGLSITRSIVEDARGHIRAESRQPGGARFVIELPVHQP